MADDLEIITLSSSDDESKPSVQISRKSSKKQNPISTTVSKRNMSLTKYPSKNVLPANVSQSIKNAHAQKMPVSSPNVYKIFALPANKQLNVNNFSRTGQKTQVNNNLSLSTKSHISQQHAKLLQVSHSGNSQNSQSYPQTRSKSYNNNISKVTLQSNSIAPKIIQPLIITNTKIRSNSNLLLRNENDQTNKHKSDIPSSVLSSLKKNGISVTNVEDDPNDKISVFSNQQTQKLSQSNFNSSQHSVKKNDADIKYIAEVQANVKKDFVKSNSLCQATVKVTKRKNSYSDINSPNKLLSVKKSGIPPEKLCNNKNAVPRVSYSGKVIEETKSLINANDKSPKQIPRNPQFQQSYKTKNLEISPCYILPDKLPSETVPLAINAMPFTSKGALTIIPLQDSKNRSHKENVLKSQPSSQQKPSKAVINNSLKNCSKSSKNDSTPGTPFLNSSLSVTVVNSELNKNINKSTFSAVEVETKSPKPKNKTITKSTSIVEIESKPPQSKNKNFSKSTFSTVVIEKKSSQPEAPKLCRTSITQSSNTTCRNIDVTNDRATLLSILSLGKSNNFKPLNTDKAKLHNVDPVVICLDSEKESPIPVLNKKSKNTVKLKDVPVKIIDWPKPVVVLERIDALLEHLNTLTDEQKNMLPLLPKILPSSGHQYNGSLIENKCNLQPITKKVEPISTKVDLSSSKMKLIVEDKTTKMDKKKSENLAFVDLVTVYSIDSHSKLTKVDKKNVGLKKTDNTAVPPKMFKNESADSRNSVNSSNIVHEDLFNKKHINFGSNIFEYNSVSLKRNSDESLDTNQPTKEQNQNNLHEPISMKVDFCSPKQKLIAKNGTTKRDNIKSENLVFINLSKFDNVAICSESTKANNYNAGLEKANNTAVSSKVLNISNKNADIRNSLNTNDICKSVGGDLFTEETDFDTSKSIPDYNSTSSKSNCNESVSANPVTEKALDSSTDLLNIDDIADQRSDKISENMNVLIKNSCSHSSNVSNDKDCLKQIENHGVVLSDSVCSDIDVVEAVEVNKSAHQSDVINVISVCKKNALNVSVSSSVKNLLSDMVLMIENSLSDFTIFENQENKINDIAVNNKNLNTVLINNYNTNMTNLELDENILMQDEVSPMPSSSSEPQTQLIISSKEENIRHLISNDASMLHLNLTVLHDNNCVNLSVDQPISDCMFEILIKVEQMLAENEIMNIQLAAFDHVKDNARLSPILCDEAELSKKICLPFENKSDCPIITFTNNSSNLLVENSSSLLESPKSNCTFTENRSYSEHLKTDSDHKGDLFHSGGQEISKIDYDENSSMQPLSAEKSLYSVILSCDANNKDEQTTSLNEVLSDQITSPKLSLKRSRTELSPDKFENICKSQQNVSKRLKLEYLPKPNSRSESPISFETAQPSNKEQDNISSTSALLSSPKLSLKRNRIVLSPDKVKITTNGQSPQNASKKIKFENPLKPNFRSESPVLFETVQLSDEELQNIPSTSASSVDILELSNHERNASSITKQQHSPVTKPLLEIQDLSEILLSEEKQNTCSGTRSLVEISEEPSKEKQQNTSSVSVPLVELSEESSREEQQNMLSISVPSVEISKEEKNREAFMELLNYSKSFMHGASESEKKKIEKKMVQQLNSTKPCYLGSCTFNDLLYTSFDLIKKDNSEIFPTLLQIKDELKKHKCKSKKVKDNSSPCIIGSSQNSNIDLNQSTSSLHVSVESNQMLNSSAAFEMTDDSVSKDNIVEEKTSDSQSVDSLFSVPCATAKSNKSFPNILNDSAKAQEGQFVLVPGAMLHSVNDDLTENCNDDLRIISHEVNAAESNFSSSPIASALKLQQKTSESSTYSNPKNDTAEKELDSILSTSTQVSHISELQVPLSESSKHTTLINDSAGSSMSCASASTSRTESNLKYSNLVASTSSFRNENTPKNSSSIATTSLKSNLSSSDTKIIQPATKDDIRNEMRIKKLEKCLEKLDREIKKFQKKELTLDDLDKDDSTYVKEDLYKKKFCVVWKKLCKFKKTSSRTGRIIEKRFRYEGSRYKAINEAIQNLVNKKKASEKFPDYSEVLNIVKTVNDKKDIGLSDREISREAERVFKDVGIVLQERRCRDDADLFGCYLTDEFNPSKDPAEHDEHLKEVLDENKKKFETSINQLIDDYVEKQKQAPALSEEENHEKTSDEEDEEEEEEVREKVNVFKPSTSKLQDDDLPVTDPESPLSDGVYAMDGENNDDDDDVYVVGIPSYSDNPTDPEDESKKDLKIPENQPAEIPENQLSTLNIPTATEPIVILDSDSSCELPHIQDLVGS